MDLSWQSLLSGLQSILGGSSDPALAGMATSIDANPAALADPASAMAMGQQGMPSGGFMGGPANWLNLLTQIQQGYGASQYGSNQLEMMKKIQALQMMAAQRAMAFNPARLAQNAIRDTLPINRQLAYQVGQAEDANLAAKGMSQAPGATAAGQAAALAPYAQQNQEMGQRMALAGAQIGQNGLQFPFSMSSPDYLQTLNELGTLGQNSAFPGSR